MLPLPFSPGLDPPRALVPEKARALVLKPFRSLHRRSPSHNTRCGFANLGHPSIALSGFAARLITAVLDLAQCDASRLAKRNLGRSSTSCPRTTAREFFAENRV